MLPAGQYVVEMIVPPGYELVKEEDKNILIGDNYIAPVTQEFPGLATAIYILPDQAEVGAAYNANNAQNSTVAFGRTTLPSHEGDTGSVETFWPCVGQARVVPDSISLFPQSAEVAPFAGATRNLCDRKLVTLTDQSAALAKFWVFTSAHVAAHFSGVITDDFTSEFDPFSPQFGEKFSPANLPVALKDWSGTEISRVYSDHWGTYNGLTYSTWEVNPPNPTGYAPTMMVTCMNDPGTGPTPDPLYSPDYSQFCYEIPFMPGQTQYMDTPVTPTSGFAGAGYNNPDCAYPAATPAIKEVDGDGVGPYVSAAGKTLTISALGDQLVNNNGYSGPAASTAPFNQKTVTRKYSFGTCGTVSTTGTGPCSVALVGSDGVAHALTSVSWGDLVIKGTVPSGLPDCPVQQQSQYGGSTAQCGQLVITAANGKQSIDAVTVTIGGKVPTRVLASGSIQSAIDAAAPGDLIIVNPGIHSELLLMWKPLRLQGVGAASSIIDANAHPAGKLDPWRAHVNCLFGLALNGQPVNEGGTISFPPALTGPIPSIVHNPYDPTGVQSCPAAGWNYFTGGANNPQIDRLPLEATLGWDTSLNGNLAELLQEPSLMGAYEGAGITVLAKGVRYPPAVNTFGVGADTLAGSSVAHEGQMPVPTVELTSNDCLNSATPQTNPFPSNFQCNPSRIDGLSVTNSSQGGGGIFVHAWGHNLEISNNRITNNTGTLSGGIVIGQGESPDALLSGNGGDPLGYNGGVLAGFDQQPWTCVPGAVVRSTTSPSGFDQVVSPPGTVANQQLPYCYNLNINVHHNAVTKNSSIGDELFSSTPAGAGGVTFCTGADYYKFNYNWVCGNLSTGDGGGFAHLGFIYNGDIEHNQILFNQSTNPTVPANGGGIVIMSSAPDGAPATATAGVTECGSVTDVDCAPGLSDGTGPGLAINANLIMGNAAESGSGGGIRLQNVNGTEVAFFAALPSFWNGVNVTNNIIANNVAGWDGAGVSLQDALKVNLINNTVVSNDTTASSGVLFNTLGAPVASSSGPTCTANCGTSSLPQPAGLATTGNSSLLTASLPATVVCPVGHGPGGTGILGLTNGACRNFSYPLLANDVFWQNRSFYIGVGSLGSGTLNQQNVVALYKAFTSTQAATQPTADALTANGNGAVITGGTGACVSASYWDIGVRGDTGPANHTGSTFTRGATTVVTTLAPTSSVLTDAADYPGNNNSAANPTLVSQYCNGSRTPPEYLSMGYQVPPGISDATVPNPIFNLTPAATVDEGNNWINISWGPLAETNPVSGSVLGNYALAAGSPAIGYISVLTAPIAYALAPNTDYFGNPRKVNLAPVDVGAVAFVAAPNTPIAAVTGGPLAFGSVAVNTTSAARTLTLRNTGTGDLTGIVVTLPAQFSRAGGTCGATLTVAAVSCTIIVTFTPTAAGAVGGALTIIAGNASVTGSPVTVSGTGIVAVSTATVTPAALAFGNWATGTTSAARTVTVRNTGTLALAGGVLTAGAPFSRPAGTAGGTCGATLAVGASCTVNVVFAPTAAAAVSGSLTIAYTGATVTPAVVTLSGTGVATQASLSISPNPLTITLPTGSTSGTGVVTLTNTAAAGGAQVSVTNVAVTATGGSSTTFNFSVTNNSCTAALAPGASCAVTVRFRSLAGTARGVNRLGTITFTDNGAASPQSGQLVGLATP